MVTVKAMRQSESRFSPIHHSGLARSLRALLFSKAMNPEGSFAPRFGLFPAVTAALAAAGLISTAQAQVQVAGDLLINVDATSLATGPINSIPNAGTLGGVFEARGGGRSEERR